MEQSPSWEVNRFSANQEIPRILWHLKGYYSIHKSLPLLPIPNQINPVHAPTIQSMPQDFLEVFKYQPYSCFVLSFFQMIGDP